MRASDGLHSSPICWQRSHHDLQSSTTPACTWQGTCSRTGQPATNCSTNSSAGCWAPLHALMADSRGSPSGPEMPVLACRNSEATTTASPVTTKWCDPAAVLVRSLFKSTIQIRSALPAFIRLTEPNRGACISVSNTCSNAQSWNLEHDEVFQRIFQSLCLHAQEQPKRQIFQPEACQGSHNYFSQW